MAVSANEYTQLSQIEHVLLRADMYLGPVSRMSRPGFCYDLSTKKILQKQVLHSKGQEQAFKEIIGNAADNVLRSRQAGLDPLRIEIAMDAEWVVVKNYGRHIPVGINDQTGKYAIEMIFGSMHSGSNFDDEVERLYIGKNGIGAKATNIFSRGFRVRCADPIAGLLYEQLWEFNMSVCHPPTITSYSGPGFTEVSYLLDFERFGVETFDEEALELYAFHAASLSFICKLPVKFNEITFRLNSIVELAGMFFTKQKSISYTDPKGTYEICLVDTPDAGIHVSFVNGMITENGGAHVDAAYKVVVTSIVELLGKSVQGIRLTRRDVQNHVSVFISCRLDKPSFVSQVKDTLAKPEPKLDLPQKLIEGIRKWTLIETIYSEIDRKQGVKLKKTIGNSSRSKKRKWGKATPANAAGSKESHRCIYILTEGDSADTYSVKFISHVPGGMGREYYGSQPLRGKLPNTLNADFIDILNNKELMAICHNINLNPDVDYSDPANMKTLHYGKILIFPDPDNDGKHILGLVLLFFIVKFPELVRQGFITFLRIPTVRVTIDGRPEKYYSNKSFKDAMTARPNARVGKVQYFKGLATSTDKNIEEDYYDPRVVTFRMDDRAMERVQLAFNRVQADLRKEWISDWVHREVIDVESMTDLPISLFIDHELIDYSIENIIRSIPSAHDGLKESQRKVLFAAMKELKGGKQLKVEQMANHTAKVTNYKHGPISLAETIVLMTQEFVGANNMPYFTPEGQFGTRMTGTKINVNPRYPNIGLQYWLPLVFRPEDKKLLKRIDDEGQKQEYEQYYPILPMHVINGIRGIGTAYSTRIPAHSPLDIVEWLKRRLAFELDPTTPMETFDIKPWYRGFTGSINLIEDGFTTEGVAYRADDGSLVIDELPVSEWTNKFKKRLDEMVEQGVVSDYKDYCTDDKVKFILYDWNDGDPTLKKLKLANQMSYKNMTVLFRSTEGNVEPRIFTKLEELLESFFVHRLAKYGERRVAELQEIETEIALLNERARYIHLVAVSRELEVSNRPESDILADLDRHQLSHEWLDKVRDREKNKESIDRLLANVEKRREQKAALERTRDEELYLKELDEFLEAYTKMERVREKEIEALEKRRRGGN